MRYCKKCKIFLGDQENYCSLCGQPLRTAYKIDRLILKIPIIVPIAVILVLILLLPSVFSIDFVQGNNTYYIYNLESQDLVKLPIEDNGIYVAGATYIYQSRPLLITIVGIERLNGKGFNYSLHIWHSNGTADGVFALQSDDREYLYSLSRVLTNDTYKLSVISDRGSRQKDAVTDIRIMSEIGETVQLIDYHYLTDIDSKLLSLVYVGEKELFLAPITIGVGEALNDESIHLAWIDFNGNVVEELDLDQQVKTITWIPEIQQYMASKNNEFIFFNPAGETVDMIPQDQSYSFITSLGDRQVFLENYDDLSSPNWFYILWIKSSLYTIGILVSLIIIFRRLLLR